MGAEETVGKKYDKYYKRLDTLHFFDLLFNIFGEFDYSPNLLAIITCKCA